VPPVYSVDAHINMGDSGFTQAQTLTSGTASPWYLSPVVLQFYGGTPDQQQRLDFTSSVIERVQAAFQRSGLNVSLTSDPEVLAAHTLSVVSNTRSTANPDAVGITDVGRDGFTFLDKLGYASSLDELQWAIAHNVAHELMHAFGVARHDATGGYLDSAVADWSALVSPSTVFSPEAIRALSTRSFRENTLSMAYGAQEVGHGAGCLHCQSVLAPAAVPEPAALVAWLAALTATAAAARARGIRA
jgi:hypothetical protein